MNSRSTGRSACDDVTCSHQLAVLSLSSCVATFLIASIYPSGRPADELMSLSFGQTYAWIAAQALVLTLPGLILGNLVGAVLPRLGLLLGAAVIFAIPLIVWCDVMTFTWLAERFLSETMFKIATTLLPGLMLYVTRAMIIETSLAAVGTVVLLLVLWRVSGMASRWWRSRANSVAPSTASAVLLSVAALLSWPAVANFGRTVSEMGCASTRHPFCVFHIVGYRGVGVPSPGGRGETTDRLRGLRAVAAVQAGDRRQEEIHLTRPLRDEGPAQPQVNPAQPQVNKVLFVVIECLRPEIVNPQVMPNLHAFAEKSIVCQRNFSTGNATSYGMFGMVTGLDAIWFRRPVGGRPILNRLLHEAGFRIGYYGGDDYRQFDMDGFIAPDHFDDFQIEPPDLPHSDRRTVDRAIRFLQRETGHKWNDETDRGRVSVAYMFATHSRYSDPEDQIFQPAVPESSQVGRPPEMKDKFYNAYKNSARTMDRLVKPLLREDCVVIILGDHGEPILDDGTAGHGTRLSRFQNMTPAVIYYPGVVPRTIESPTYHADLLPTLLSILDLTVTDSSVFDGVDLTQASDETLSQRVFVSRNYLDSTSLLVGPWTFDPKQPFGYRVVFDIYNWQCRYLNPIDDYGFEWEASADDEGRQRFANWVTDRFGVDLFGEETLSDRELFETFFAASDQETRLAALKIACDVAAPDRYLYDLIAGATRDESAEVRQYAHDAIIRINRYAGAADRER
jgi:hypothetical protein